MADVRIRGSPLHLERLTGQGAGQFSQELLQVGEIDRLDQVAVAPGLAATGACLLLVPSR